MPSEDQSPTREVEVDERAVASASRGVLANASASATQLTLERGASVGRYLIVGEIGAGGMGVVYAAFDPDLNRKVALKILKVESVSSESGSSGHGRLLREAQAMARLSHPNVITVHDVGTISGQVFVAMEFVEGPTLKEWLADGRRWDEVAEVFAQAGRGLAAAHDAGLVHRDFKPSNVLIGAKGRVRVLDFGLARRAEDGSNGNGKVDQTGTFSPGANALDAQLTQTGLVMGTPAYMAPEQLDGEGATAKADQFSFSVALFEGLFNKRPFSGDNPLAIAARIAQGKIEQPAKDSPVPPWLRKVVHRGLEGDPDNRFPTIKAMVEELERAPARRGRRWLLGGGVVGVLAAGVGYAAAADEPDKCVFEDDTLGGVWDDGRKTEIAAAFLASGAASAADSWERASGVIDGYVDGWLSMRIDACEAANVRGEQSAELMDLRMACLERRRDELGALIDVFSGADASVVVQAVPAAHALVGVEACSDLEALTASVKPPEDPQVRKQVDELRGALGSAKAMQLAGKYAEATDTAVDVLQRTEGLDYIPVRAEAQYRLGSLQRATGEVAASDQMLREAVELAEASRHDEIIVRASIELAAVAGGAQAEHSEGHLWADRAAAVLKRMPPEPGLDAEIANARGRLLLEQGAYQHAREQHQRALDLLQKLRGEEHPDVARTLNHLGNAYVEEGAYDDGLERFIAALVIQEKTLGSDHPDVARTLNNMGNAYDMQGKDGHALAQYERSLKIREAAMGARHPDVAGTRVNLAHILLRTGERDEAREHFEQSLAVFEEVLGADHPHVALPLQGLALMASEQGNHAAALQDYERALEIQTKALGPSHPDLGYLLTSIGRVHLDRGQPGDAVPVLQRALEIREVEHVDPRMRAGSMFMLARALWHDKAQRPRADSLARAAHGIHVDLDEEDSRAAAQIEAWLQDR